MVAYLLPYPAAPGLIPSIPPKNSEENIVNVAEVNQRRWFEESEQLLENVDRTHYKKISKWNKTNKIKKKKNKLFNQIFSSGRVVIEHVNGILKAMVILKRSS